MAAEDYHKRAEQYRVETECVNQLAELKYDLSVPAPLSAKMRDRSVDLLDVLHVMKYGRVIWSGMKDRAGLWVVSGSLLDGGSLDVTLTFQFSELYAELIDIT